MTAAAYSQSDEQRVILSELMDARIGQGALLDIGAYDGETFSNTRALMDCGWCGVFVEPSPGPARKLLEMYSGNPDAVVVLAAVAAYDGVRRMSLTDDGLSTFSESHAWKWAATGGYFDVKSFVPCISWRTLMNTIVDQCLTSDLPIEMVSIDTEGDSLDVFRAMPHALRPKVLVVERDIGLSSELGRELSCRGYRVVHETRDNIIGVRSNV